MDRGQRRREDRGRSWLRRGRPGREPRNASGFQKLEKARKRILPEHLRKEGHPAHPSVPAVRPRSDLRNRAIPISHRERMRPGGGHRAGSASALHSGWPWCRAGWRDPGRMANRRSGFRRSTPPWGPRASEPTETDAETLTAHSAVRAHRPWSQPHGSPGGPRLLPPATPAQEAPLHPGKVAWRGEGSGPWTPTSS